MSSHPIPTRRSGFSLIEVAIALAIFVFGALAIVQIFPPALGVIRNNESRVTATQLSESMLARSPDAIYDVELDDDGNLVLDTNGNPIWVDTPYAVVGTASKNASLPAGPTETQFESSALNHFRYIRGERQGVRRATLDDDDISYVILDYPYHPNTPATPGMVRAFREVTLEGVRIEGIGNLNFEMASESGHPKPNLTYYVSYRWQEDGAVHGVIDEPFKYQSGIGDFEKRVLQSWRNSDENRILAGSVSVRYREEIALPDPEPSDGPIEKVGMLRIPEGVSGALSFDYLVDDWRILISKNETDADGRVALPLRNPIFEDGQIYGLDEDFDPADRSLKLLLDTPKMSTPQHTVDARRGILEYENNPAVVRRFIRTAYRTVDGWAQQLSVAAKSYIPFYENTGWIQSRTEDSLPREPWREYLWHNDVDDEDNNKLFFHPSEAGKSVSVSYVNSANETVDVVLTINNTRTGTGVPVGFFGSGNDDGLVAPVTITDLQGDDIGPADIKSILSVKGLSVQVRAAWQEGGGRYNQVILPGQRTLMQ